VRLARLRVAGQPAPGTRPGLPALDFLNVGTIILVPYLIY
jgi:hypothetical protein